MALHFVQDNKTRFKLALACGNIQVAMDVAYDLGDDAWRQLGVEALRQGNHEVVEMSYQKTKEFERLSFLYLITGNTEKLRKMLKIAEMRGDVMSRFHNALFLGDAEERLRVLELTGQLSLAYLTAASHGLPVDAERLLGLLEAVEVPVPQTHPQASLLQPMTPICRGENWPLLAISKSSLADVGKSHGRGVSSMQDDDDIQATSAGSQWGEDDLFDDEIDNEKSVKASSEKSGEGKSGWEDDELSLSDDEAPVSLKGSKQSNTDADFFVLPQGGTPANVIWSSESSLAVDHFSAGSVESGLQLLNRQIALANARPLRPIAIKSFLGANCFLPGLPLIPSNKNYLLREVGKSSSGKSLPAVSLKTPYLLDLLKQAYRSFTSAQFTECRASLDTIIQSIPLVVAANKLETNDIKELLDICREYITALRLKTAMGETEDATRSLELAAYFTHSNLQPAHLMLALKTAMANAFKSKNFINAASFARRLLELPDINSERHTDTRSKAQKVLQKSEQQGRNEFAIDYDEMNPFSLDCQSLKPIYKGSAAVKCPYCASTYTPSCKGILCNTCSLSTVGLETVGLITQAVPASRK